MGNVLSGLEPKIVWEFFEEILQHPHPSKKEEKLANYLKGWAKDNNYEIQEDAIGNFVIRKPATPGMEDRKPIVIQGHIDMVCEKNSDVEFDFENDAIQPYIDGDWVKAKGTTLGADNGLGIAMGMAIMNGDIPHPDMELLCTLDEETGLTGAMQLGTELLKGDILINLDSEEDGHFTIGCAGGQNTSGTFFYEQDAIPGSHSKHYKIGVKGCMGGHSGIEIHDGRANALKLLNRLLWDLTKKFDIRLSSLNAGSAHNAIPREAFAIITAPADNEHFNMTKFIEDFDKMLKEEWQSKEKNIEVICENSKADKVMSKDFQKRLIDSLYLMPHGPERYSPDIEGLVQTSTNLAKIETRANELFVLTSQRSSVESEKTDMANVVRTSIEVGGGVAKHGDGYPAWEPNMDSPILKTAIKIFEEIFDKEPVIEAIHAGLECGLIGEKYPHMDMLSFGPNLADVHSPDEKVQISTVQNCWKLLVEVIKNTPKK